MIFPNSLDPDPAQPDKTSGLIWIQTVWLSYSVPERIFEKKVTFEKSQQTTKIMKKLSSMQRVDQNV